MGAALRLLVTHSGHSALLTNVVADDAAGEAGQDRREVGQSWAVCDVPDGGGGDDPGLPAAVKRNRLVFRPAPRFGPVTPYGPPHIPPRQAQEKKPSSPLARRRQRWDERRARAPFFGPGARVAGFARVRRGDHACPAVPVGAEPVVAAGRGAPTTVPAAVGPAVACMRDRSLLPRPARRGGVRAGPSADGGHLGAHPRAGARRDPGGGDGTVQHPGAARTRSRSRWW